MLGVAVAVFVVVRVVARHGAGQTGWTRTEVIASALASGIVAALAWIVALRFATTDRRGGVDRAIEPVLRARVFDDPGRVHAGRRGDHRSRDEHRRDLHDEDRPAAVRCEGRRVDATGDAGRGCRARCCVARRARPAADTRWTGRAFLAVVAGVALFLGAYGAEQALIAHPQLAASSLQSHAFVAFGVVAVVLALATLSLIMNGLREQPDADEEIRAIGSAAP